MKWVAVMGLVIAGVVELALRMAFALVLALIGFILAISIVGWVVLLLVFEEQDVQLTELLRPWCFDMVEKLVEYEPELARENGRLRQELLQLRELELLERS